MNEKNIDLLANEPVYKAIIKLSIPMVMGMMVQVFYNLVDTYFIGMLGDSSQLAASNIALPIFILLMGIASIIGTGASSYISRCLGSKDYEQANKTTSISAGLLLMIAIIVTVLGLAFCKPLVKALGASGDTYEYTYQYVSIMLIGSIAVIGNFAFGQLLRAEGSAMKSMMGMVIGTILNLILDPIFIFKFNLGVSGAALATIVGNMVGFIYYLACFIKGNTVLKIKLRLFSFDKKILGEIFKIGLPSSFNQILMGAATIVANNIAIQYGTQTVAGMGVAAKIMMIGTFIFIGFSTGCQPIIGYSYGAGDLNRAKEVIKIGTRLTCIIGIVLLVVFAISSPILIGLFTKEAKVIDKGTVILRALIWSLPFVGGQMIATTAAQSMGKAIPAMILSISRQGLLYIPLLLILNAVLGFNGFIYAQPATDIIMMVLSSIYISKIFAKELLNINGNIDPKDTTI